jgi:nitrate reductase gamma subunit
MSHCAGRDHLLPIAPVVIKDPADLIEKPLHLVGLHHASAMAVVAVAALVLGVGLVLLLRRRALRS